MANYTTANPGDIRRRTRYIGIRTPLNAPPQVEVLEQEAILTATGERVLADLGNLPVGAFDPDESFPLKDPTTDELFPGQTSTVGQAMVIIYSWIREKQKQRDTVEEIARTAQLALADVDNGAAQ